MDNKIDQNLISLMVEETFSLGKSFNIESDLSRNCLVISYNSFTFEVPKSWSELPHIETKPSLLSSEFVDVLNKELMTNFDTIQISLLNGEYIISANYQADNIYSNVA